MNTAMDCLIEIEKLDVAFSQGNLNVPVIRNASFGLNRGDYISLMGPSGAGKSTLLAVLGLLIDFDCGRYRFDGLDIKSLSRKRRAAVRGQCIGFVFQDFHLLPRATALENVCLPLIHQGVAGNERRKRGHEMLEVIGLSDKHRSRPNELSGGEKQRVAVARALINKPKLILADEPTGSLDSKNGQSIINLIESFVSDTRTIVIVTHDQEIARRAQRRLVMKDGIVQETE